MWSSFTEWFHAPFSRDASAFDVVLTTGLILIAVAFWMMVLTKMRELT